jgi:DNA-binding transcriptional MocR family regulator
MPADASWSRPEGGYFIWLDNPTGPETGPLLARAEAAGVTFVKGTDFFVGGRGGERSMRLAFSFPSPDEIREGVARLAGLLSPASAASV